MRIGIFGGSFDPVHVEHVRLAESAIECLQLDKLFIMPASKPPHKKDKTLSSDKDRLAMCRLAFVHLPSAEVCSYEIDRGGTSYTYLTCRHFKEQYPTAEIFWLVGTDMLRNFPSWKNPSEILSYVTLAVCARDESPDWLNEEQEKFYGLFQKHFAVISYAGRAVSSTEIRVDVAAGEDVTPYVGEAVKGYIDDKKLYKLPFVEDGLFLENERRRAHSIRVAKTAASRASALKLDEQTVVIAALLHDCAKNIPDDFSLLRGFTISPDTPRSVVHQFAGAYIAEKKLGVTDEDVINAIRYHTSGRENMSMLEKLIFLADMVEPERSYDGVDEIRALYYSDDTLDKCMLKALEETIKHLQNKKARIFELTERAYLFYKRREKLWQN